MRKALTLALVAALLPIATSRAALPQNDAGSGRDAPDMADARFRIEPGRVYDGTIDGIAGSDSDDFYAFTAPAGAPIEARMASSLGCLYLYDAFGTQLDYGCSASDALPGVASATATSTGTYFVSVGYVHPHTYKLSVGVGAPAPSPTAVDADISSNRGAIPDVSPATPKDKHVVVAVIDSGINPYHEFFRAPALSAHPSTWLPGFPRGAKSVRLSLGAADQAAATAADAETFADLERSVWSGDEVDEHLYTFPGTRIVGGISFGEFVDNTDVLAAERMPIRDDYGHGTHSAGLAAGANLPRADGNVLIVAVEVGKGGFDDGIRWAARQPWIDALSVSLGTVANVPTNTPGKGASEAATREAAANGKPVFVASGNGFSDVGLGPDRCTTYSSEYTGPIWITRVGAATPNSGGSTTWHCVPVDVIARTNVQSVAVGSFTGGENASGTSASTPNVAGHFAHLLLAARRSGQRLSRAQVLDYLLRTAAPPPLTVGTSSPSIQPLSLADQGYGLVDQRSLTEATRLVTGNIAPPDRPETEAWFAQDSAIRVWLWGPPPA